MRFEPAMALLQEGEWERGARELRAALAGEPGNAAAWSNLGFALRKLGRPQEAREALERAVALQPTLADAWYLLGLTAHDEARNEDARAAFERTLALRPGFAEAHYNLGALHDHAGRLDQAARHYLEALRGDPGYGMARANLAHLLVRAEQLDGAIGHLREAIRIDPRFAKAQIQLAHCCFLAGRFAEAWDHHQWRESRNAHALALANEGRDYVVPAELPAHARLLVMAEQGLGDNLFFLRFAPALVAKGATLLFAGDVRLHPLLLRTGLFERAATDVESLRDARAIEVLAGDLALLSPPGTVPPALPLAIDRERGEAMVTRLAKLQPAPRVALAWRAGLPHEGTFTTLYKELPIAAFGASLRGTQATWISVQRNPQPGELAALSAAIGAPVHDFSDVNANLDDALAAMTLVDDYIGVSSTNVHLRAGAGGTARVLVPFPPEWRWMMRGESAWFPGTRVYRQRSDGDWSEALRQLGSG
jgi:tetratricopeptide (TPR) repeat protein